MSGHRALLTDRERAVLSGEADATRNYVYQVRARLQTKLDRLATDIDLLAEHQPDLLEELLDVVRPRL